MRRCINLPSQPSLTQHHTRTITRRRRGAPATPHEITVTQRTARRAVTLCPRGFPSLPAEQSRTSSAGCFSAARARWEAQQSQYHNNAHQRSRDQNVGPELSRAPAGGEPRGRPQQAPTSSLAPLKSVRAAYVTKRSASPLLLSASSSSPHPAPRPAPPHAHHARRLRAQAPPRSPRLR